MTSETVVSAPGKVIISGEHSVVYGYPALVAAAGLYARAKFSETGKGLTIYPNEARGIVKRSLKNVQRFMDKKYDGLEVVLKSNIPIGSGMGSSAAIAVSVTAGLMKVMKGKIDLKTAIDAAYETEKYYHGNPSGVDVAISTYGGVLWYRKESDNFKVLSRIEPTKRLKDFVLINTGRPKENTAQMVKKVNALYNKSSRRVDNIFRKIEKVTRDFLRYVLTEEGVSLNELIIENQRYLEELGVVSTSTIDLIRKIEKIGGAAKISGAGGKSGSSGVLLAYHPDIESLLHFARKQGVDTLKTSFGVEGVHVEKS